MLYGQTSNSKTTRKKRIVRNYVKLAIVMPAKHRNRPTQPCCTYELHRGWHSLGLLRSECGVEYCDECFCLSVCRAYAYLSNPMSELHQISCACDCANFLRPVSVARSSSDGVQWRLSPNNRQWNKCKGRSLLCCRISGVCSVDLHGVQLWHMTIDVVRHSTISQIHTNESHCW